MNQKLVAAVLAASLALAAGCIQPDRTGPNEGAQPVIKGETFYLCGHTRSPSVHRRGVRG
jgi:hypothetical protein